MNRKTGRRIVLGALTIAVIAVTAGCYAYYALTVHLNVLMTVNDLGDVYEAFQSFRDARGRWPERIDEVYGIRISEGVINERYRDHISDAPFECVVANKLWYAKGAEKPFRVLVVLPRPYRSRLWPFGETRTIILTDAGQVGIISPSEIGSAGGAPEKRGRQHD